MTHHNNHPPRFCTNHQGFYPVDGGVWLKSGTTRRWICASCRARRAERLKLCAPVGA